MPLLHIFQCRDNMCPKLTLHSTLTDKLKKPRPSWARELGVPAVNSVLSNARYLTHTYTHAHIPWPMSAVVKSSQAESETRLKPAL